MQAPPYDRQTDFAEQERLNAGGRSTVNTAQLNAELDGASASINQLKENLELIQRDDGKLRDATVEPNALAASTIAFLGGSNFNPRGAWVTATAYQRIDMVSSGGINYVALSPHTSSALFATDLSAGKWQPFTGQQVASGTVFSPAGSLSSTNVQAALEEVQNNQLTNTRALLAASFGAL